MRFGHCSPGGRHIRNIQPGRDLETSRFRVVAIACFMTISTVGGAQTVAGSVRQADAGVAVSNATITILDTAGRTVARGASGANGAYQLRPPSAGSYELRVTRIGFRPFSGHVVIPPSRAVTVDVFLVANPVALPQVDVDGRRDCSISSVDAARFLQLWRRARAASLSEVVPARDLSLRVVAYRAHEDAVWFHGNPGLGPIIRAAHHEDDLSSAREILPATPVATAPPESLLLNGYLRARGLDNWAYEAPNSAVLLTDEFSRRHCFTLEHAPGDHPDWIGVGFRTSTRGDGTSDVNGTAWFDSTTATIRRVAFEYTNVPADTIVLCFYPGDRATTRCSRFLAPMDRLGLGGVVDFAALPDGDMVAVRWAIRTVPDTVVSRYTGFKIREAGHGSERCYTGSDCHELWYEWPRLVVAEGIVARIMQDGREVYRDTAADSILARRR